MDNNLETYNQWVEITIICDIEDPVLKIKNAELVHGKFYKDGDKDINVSTDKINEIQIRQGSPGIINSSGKSGALSGTEGNFEIWYGEKERLGMYSWNCPYASSTNKSIWTDLQDPQSPLFYVHFIPGSGAKEGKNIGNVQLEFYAN